MQKREAERYLGKKVRVILSNRFHFSGKVLEVSEDTLILFDKFNIEVSIKISDIIVCSEVSNGY
jgi:ribosome maturation factor RimP